MPDATSLLRLRYLLEQHKLGEKLFAELGKVQASGMTLKTGTIVEATIVAAPVRRRIKTRSAIRRCTRPATAGSGISA